MLCFILCVLHGDNHVERNSRKYDHSRVAVTLRNLDADNVTTIFFALQEGGWITPNHVHIRIITDLI